MCGRYALLLAHHQKELLELVQQIERMILGFSLPVGDVRPTDLSIALGMEGLPQAMGWGMNSPQGGLIRHARRETLLQRPMFSEAFLLRRCLIPSSGFYEWKLTPGGKIKHWFQHPDGSPLWMAGLYNSDLPIPRFVVITQAATGDMAPIHDRMPLILATPAQREAWLRDTDAARDVLAQGFQDPLAIQVCGDQQLSLFD